MATTQPDATPHLLAFAARYDADPAGVAAVIAALALVSAHDEATAGGVCGYIAGYGWPAQHVESVGCTLTMAAAAGLCTVRPDRTWLAFHLGSASRVALTLLGARGWLDERLAAVRVKPADGLRHVCNECGQPIADGGVGACGCPPLVQP